MTMSPALDAGMLASPCVGTCQLDPDTGWCLGCARNIAEIGRWGGMTAAVQAEVWADLPRRKAILGLGFSLLPWAGETLLDRLLTLARRPGTLWSMGVHGATAGFRAEAPPSVESDGRSFTLRTPGGALHLYPRPGTRAFELIGPSGQGRLALALHRSRLREPLALGVTEMGADEGAIDEAARSQRLFDLGLNRPPIRFCVRTRDPALLASLRAAWGRSVLDPAAGLLAPLRDAAPCRVVTTLLGRVEVEGAWADLRPDRLAQDRVLGPGLALPEGYVACVSIVTAG